MTQTYQRGARLGWALLCVIAWSSSAPAQEAAPATAPTTHPPAATVLVVHSYHAAQTGHVYQMTQGIEEAFEGSGVWLVYFHMDTKRNNQAAEKQAAGRAAMEIAARLRPDVIITMDDNAQEYFAKALADRPEAPPIVFAGVNADPARYGFPKPKVTGVIERPNIKESLELLLKIRPEVKRILMLSDRSRTTNSTWEYARTLDLPLEVVGYEQPLNFDEWKAIIDRYKDKVDAFGLYVIRTIQRSINDPSLVPERELVEYLNQASKLPTVGFFDTSAQAGILCGISVSMKEQGFKAGQIARKILSGKPPSAIPISPTTKGRILLNLKTSEFLGGNIDYHIIRRAIEVVK